MALLVKNDYHAKWARERLIEWLPGEPGGHHTIARGRGVRRRSRPYAFPLIPNP